LEEGGINLPEAISFRAMQLHEVAAVSEMVLRTFHHYVAPDYGDEGIQTFSRFVQPDALADRLSRGALFLVAAAGQTIVGMIEMRSYNHVTLLFVDSAYQRRGISRELLRRALDICRQHRPDVQQITVNSSPYAVDIYRKLGFEQSAPPQEQQGIIFVPMTLTIS